MAAQIADVRGVIAALSRGVLGDGYTPEVTDRLVELLSRVASGGDRKQILDAYRLLDGRLGALAMTGRPVPVSWLSSSEAERLLQDWRASRVGLRRKLGRVASDLATFAAYSHPGPHWERIGYPGPLGPPPAGVPRLAPLTIERDEVLTCDVAIVGSGAGGGCAAARLAAAGLDVVVLEKGPYRSERDFDHVESRAARDMYLYGKTFATVDLTVRIIAGSVVGGGTLVNYATAFRAPAHVLGQWTAATGIDAFVSGELDEAFDSVSARLNVNTGSSAPGKRDVVIEDGLTKLGWHVDAIPRAVEGCSQDAGCGYCGFGCRLGAKRSTMRTYLEDAASAGARIVAGIDVRRVRIDDGRAVGVEGTAGGHRLVVRSRAVVAAAGAIETPALLLRSGLGGRVGRDLHLHPGSAVWGLFDEDIRVWEGTTQARYSSEFRHWDDGYGPLFETVPVHPGEFAPAAPWTSASDHRALMDDMARVGLCAVLPRDTTAGRVRVAKDGSPRVHYSLSAGDERRIAEGIARAGAVLEAAGARRINSPHTDTISFEPGVRGDLESWASATRERGYRAGLATFFSYHQMGSCRMGTDPATSAVGPDNESHEVRNLYVVDASTFPTASGVNPMLTVYALAHRAGGKILQRLS